jgi:uncharacterized protein (DUF305 family)
MSCKILSKDKISDNEFLNLMIKHHNVAIKMSKLIQMNSYDDFILDYARKVIYNQSEEVILMERFLKSIPNIQSDKSCNCGNTLIGTKIEKLYPGIFSNAKCDNSHFEDLGNIPLQLRMESKYETINNQNNDNMDYSHNKMNHNNLTEREYVDHMVAHHKSGVELAKLLVKSTKEPRLLLLAQTIILDQEKEMFQLNYLYNCIKYNWRNK